MPDAPLPAPMSPVVRQILDGQLRHLLTIAGTAAIAHGMATQGQVDSGVPAAADYITGTLFIIGPMAWSAASKWVAAKGWGKALQPLDLSTFEAIPPADPAALAVATRPLALDAPADTTKEKDMSIGSELKNVLGIVLGILIPGASKETTNLTTTIQNELAKVYGAAAAGMAKDLAVDTTGMSGPDKVFAITKALVATAQKDGFKGDLKVLGDVSLDIAQAAYRAAEPNFESDIVALAGALTANPLVTVAATLVGEAVQKAADNASGTAALAQAA